MNIALCLVVALIGLALFFFVKGPEGKEAGRLMFFAGLLVFLLRFAGSAALHLP